MCPPEAMSFEGVQQSFSLLITVKTMDIYAYLMLDMLENGDKFPKLQDMGVDWVEIHDKRFHLKGYSSYILYLLLKIKSNNQNLM